MPPKTLNIFSPICGGIGFDLLQFWDDKKDTFILSYILVRRKGIFSYRIWTCIIIFAVSTFNVYTMAVNVRDVTLLIACHGRIMGGGGGCGVTI